LVYRCPDCGKEMDQKEYEIREGARGHYSFDGWVDNVHKPILCKECNRKREAERALAVDRHDADREFVDRNKPKNVDRWMGQSNVGGGEIPPSKAPRYKKRYDPKLRKNVMVRVRDEE